MSSDSCHPPPPSYELSQQGHDQKIIEKNLQELLLSKIPIHDIEEERDENDSKDSKDSEEQKQKQPSGLFQTPVQPLHIQKRTPRGARPLPPSPADAQYSRSKPAAIHPIGPLKEELEHQEYHEVFSPPPPFTAVGPSLEGPPYEYSMYHASGSAPQPTPDRTSFNPPSVRYGQHRPSSSYSSAEPRAETFHRRISHGSCLEPNSKHSTLPGKSSDTRLNFNPSIAYATSSNAMYDLWEHASDSTAVNAASLYSSAVSSHLHPGSTVNPGPSHMNRFSTPPRPSASYESLTPASSLRSPASQFHSPYVPAYSASQQSLPRYAQFRSNHGGHVRWTSEVDFKDKYP
ncbi:uncharacterized protein EDB93DRAFT_620507 [Suillus bovinus]|uniref:uncharacterized protein n=1 Tax=Suillus bovinus TaxID=48563 RepID=UPI001B85E520|nr:uncharacterized protein EDB93DRAFT_620507 [Suillus bovinus]KAG2141726.1 hypothetical protein EDB93DRAFT_620507 [Suillus bovinus]